MNQITMTDITMNQNTRRAEFSLSFREKIELAKLLDRLGVVQPGEGISDPLQRIAESGGKFEAAGPQVKIIDLFSSRG